MGRKIALMFSKFNFLSNPNHPHPISRARCFQRLNPYSLLPLNPNSQSSQINPPWRSPIFCRSPNLSSSTSQNPNSKKSLRANCIFNRSFTSPSRSRKQRSSSSGIDSDELIETVELIRRDGGSMESDLSRKNSKFSHSAIAAILRSLNDSNISALRFFNWVLSSCSGLKPTPEIYNLVVANLGRLDDFKTMALLLNELSLKKHCLTEKSFSFLAFRTSSGLEVSVRGVTETLNRVGGSCRGSGIHSLIRVLCGMSCFDLAVFVMEETVRRTCYYNVLIAAKCWNGDFRDARKVLDEMRKFGCDPNMNSYNYLLGSLFKHKKVVEACDLMEAMESMGYFPDSVTFEVVAVHACKANRVDFAMEFLNRMLSEGIRPRLTMHAAFIKGYFWSGRVEDAYKYVIEMWERDERSANMNYSLLARLFWASGKVVEAGGILQEMMEKGLKPNFPVYVKVIKNLHKMSRVDLSTQLKSMFSKFVPSQESG